MDPFTENKFISTKEASEKSGYTSDYLSRLCREGKIESMQVSRVWFVGRESLDQFVDEQAKKKTEAAESLAKEREQEYRASLKSSAPAHEFVTLSANALANIVLSNRRFKTSPLAAMLITVLLLGAGTSVVASGVVSSFAQNAVAAFEATHARVLSLAPSRMESPLAQPPLLLA